MRGRAEVRHSTIAAPDGLLSELLHATTLQTHPAARMSKDMDAS